MSKSHSGFIQDPFEKAFGKKKKAHKRQPDQDEINLISDFEKLRIIDTFEHVQKRQQEETIMTPTLKQILQQSPVPEETLNEKGVIDFESMANTHPMINEYIADDIKESNELEESNKDKIVVGVFDVDELIPSSMLKAKSHKEERREEEEEKGEKEDEVYMPRFPDDEEEEKNDEDDENDEMTIVKTMVNYAYNLTSSSDDSSDPNSNSETDGMYPSDNDSDRNSENSDFDDDYDN